MRELIHQGAIGKVRHASSSRSDQIRAPIRIARGIGGLTEKQGGGALGAIGSHVVDGFRWFLGTEVSEVAANLATHIRERKDHEGRCATGYHGR